MTDDALDAAGAALSARDRDLADADAALTAVLHAAYRTAAGCVRRIDGVRAEIDAAVAAARFDSAAAAREFGAFLVAKNREIIALLTEARAHADATTLALQALADRYRRSAQH